MNYVIGQDCLCAIHYKKWFISDVVHRYGVPHSIITDNGSNFTADEVKIGVLTWALSSITPPSITRKQTVKSNEPMVLL